MAPVTNGMLARSSQIPGWKSWRTATCSVGPLHSESCPILRGEALSIVSVVCNVAVLAVSGSRLKKREGSNYSGDQTVASSESME